MPSGVVMLNISQATEETPVIGELNVGGYQWLVICPSGAPNRFTIECNEEVRDRLWLCKAEYSWQTKEADGIRWKKWQRPAMSQYWFNTFNDSSTQFVRHANTIGFRVRIEVLWSPIESCLPRLDATLRMNFGQRSELIPINQHALASHSDYFDNLFFGEEDNMVDTNNDDDDKPIYQVNENPNFDVRRFRFMVYALLCMGPSLDKVLSFFHWTGENDKEVKVALLKLAIHYQLKMFEEFAERALIALGPGTMDMLELADQFTLVALKQHCLDTIDPMDFCKDIVNNTTIRSRLSELTRQQLDESWRAKTG